MEVGYVAPLGASYRRMKAALFRPFSLHKWIVVGFACWIAGWGPGGGGSVNFHSPFGPGRQPDKILENAADGFFDIWADPFWHMVIVSSVVLLIALGIVLTWIVSRGSFVFLETVARDRTAIVEPWNRFSRGGNSLFLWRLALGLLMLLHLSAVLAAVYFIALGGGFPRSFDQVSWGILAGIVLVGWIPLLLLVLLVTHLLHHFVVPLMYRHRLRTNDAWRRLLPLLGSHTGSFVLYALFVLGLRIVVGIAAFVATCITCCIFGCFLAIPFVGTVVYLPVSYTFRALGPEFLGQFGAETIWPEPPPTAPATTPAPLSGLEPPMATGSEPSPPPPDGPLEG